MESDDKGRMTYIKVINEVNGVKQVLQMRNLFKLQLNRNVRSNLIQKILKNWDEKYPHLEGCEGIKIDWVIPLIDKIHKFCPKIGLAKHILQRLLVDKQKHNFIVEKDQTPELTPELNPEFIKKYVAENVIVNENTGFLHNCGQLNFHELQSKVMEMLKEDVEFDKILAKINFITEGHSKTIPWRWEKDLHDWFQRNRPDSNDSLIYQSAL